ncbi:unnamed protein product [Albugo candida]|uniref:Uncharacterized protein n=1 Tax=Albugo candida TaxID=65357 RepID=A0A024G8T9_9STRA|nr:unnamed protein product [Albugo candida]|eukprot:CCI43286.1 unnamed protein product [Albugo candida]
MTLTLKTVNLYEETKSRRNDSIAHKLVRIQDPNLARSLGVKKDCATKHKERRMTLHELGHYGVAMKRPQAHRQSPHYRPSSLTTSCADRLQARISWRSNADCKECTETWWSGRDTIASSDSSVRRDTADLEWKEERDDDVKVSFQARGDGELMMQQLESLESIVNEIGACLQVEQCRIASLKDAILEELSALKATVAEIRSQGVTSLLCHIGNPVFANLQPFRKAIIHAQIVSVKIDRLISRTMRVL